MNWTYDKIDLQINLKVKAQRNTIEMVKRKIYVYENVALLYVATQTKT